MIIGQLWDIFRGNNRAHVQRTHTTTQTPQTTYTAAALHIHTTEKTKSHPARAVRGVHRRSEWEGPNIAAAVPVESRRRRTPPRQTLSSQYNQHESDKPSANQTIEPMQQPYERRYTLVCAFGYYRLRPPGREPRVCSRARMVWSDRRLALTSAADASSPFSSSHD